MSHPHVLVDGTWVDFLYPSSDLKHSTGWLIDSPSGDLRASISLACPRDHQAPWLLPGKSFKIYSHAGGQIWGGITVEPERTDGAVTIHAVGIGAKLSAWDAIYDADPGGPLDEQPSFSPNDAVDYAVTTGAPFFRQSGVDLSSDFGADPVGNDSNGIIVDILTLLTRAATTFTQRVHVDRLGAITYRDNPTTASWMMTPQPDHFGTADTTYRSLLRGYFLNIFKAAFLVQLTGSPTGGTFTLEGNGDTTASIAYNASAATIQTQVQSLGGIFANSTVTLVGTQRWRITASGAGTLDGYSNLTGGTSPGISVDEAAGSSIVKAEDTAAAGKFGVKQGHIDMTKLGPITETDAQTYTDGRFALVGGRMGWTTQVELTNNNLFHAPSGLFASPRHVKAGTLLVIPGVVDARSNPTIRGAIQWVIQEVEVTEGRVPSATVTPIGFTPRDFDGALAPPENPAIDPDAA